MISVRDFLTRKINSINDIYNIINEVNQHMKKNNLVFFRDSNLDDFLIYFVRKVERGEIDKIKKAFDEIRKNKLGVSYNPLENLEINQNGNFSVTDFENNFEKQVYILREKCYLEFLFGIISKAFTRLQNSPLKVVKK